MGASWRLRGLGLRPPGNELYLSHFLFADDLVLLAANVGQLQTMIAEVSLALARIGLTLRHDKTSWMRAGAAIDVRASPAPCPQIMQLEQRQIAEEPCQQGLKILGIWIMAHGGSESHVQHRLQNAWKAFFGRQDLLLQRKLHWRVRLKYLQVYILPVLTYGMQTVKLSQHVLQVLNVTYRRMGRAIIGRERAEHESWLHWHQSTLHQVNQEWDTLHLLQLLIFYRNLTWWRHRQQLILLHGDHLRHPSRYKIYRWEEPVDCHYRGKSLEWHDVAQNGILWKAEEQLFVQSMEIRLLLPRCQ